MTGAERQFPVIVRSCGGHLVPTIDPGDRLRVGSVEVVRKHCARCAREIYGSDLIVTCPILQLAGEA